VVVGGRSCGLRVAGGWARADDRMGHAGAGLGQHVAVRTQDGEAHACGAGRVPQLGQRAPLRGPVELGGERARRPLVPPPELRPGPAEVGACTQPGPEVLPRLGVERLDLEPVAVGGAERRAGRRQGRAGHCVAQAGGHHEVVRHKQQAGLEDRRRHRRHRPAPSFGDARGDRTLGRQEPGGHRRHLQAEAPGCAGVAPVHLHEAGERLDGGLAARPLQRKMGRPVPGDQTLDPAAVVEPVQGIQPPGAGVDGELRTGPRQGHAPPCCRT